MVAFKSLYPPMPEIPDPLNVHDCLFDWLPKQFGLTEFPSWPYLEDADTGFKLTSVEFRDRVRDGAIALRAELGISKENRDMVGILSDNCVDYITLVHALLYSTIPVVPLSSYSTPFELEYLLKQAKVTHIFVHPRLLPLALDAAQKVGIESRNIHLLEHHARFTQHVDGRRSFGDMIKSARDRGLKRIPAGAAPRNTLAYLLFSSGTSGKPKAVMISHNNICGQVIQWAVAGVEIEKVVKPPPAPNPTGYHVELMFLPFHHTYGLSATSFRALMSPTTVLIMPQWNIKHALDLILKHKISRVPMIPSVVHALVQALVERSKQPGFNRDMLKSLMAISSGAAYLPPALGEQLKTFMPNVERVNQGFGMSETTMSAANQVPDGCLGGKTKWVPGSVGLILPGLEARFIKADGTDGGVGEPGELLLRGPTMAMGYWGKEFEQQTRDTFLPGGWMRTGDIFRIDEHGNLFFEDRAKDTLKVSGMQVAPTEIEDMLTAHPDKLVTDASVAGVRGGRTSDEKVPRAWVTLSAAGQARGERETIEALDAWVKQNLSKYKWLRGGIGIVDEIPKSPTGKVLRRNLVEAYEKQLSASEPKAKL